MNSISVSGRLVKAPVAKYTTSGMAITSFAVAVRVSKDETYFPFFKAFDKVAQQLEKWGTKGRFVIIQGHISTGNYIKDGKKIYTTDLIADRVEFCDKGEEMKPDDIDKAVQIEGFTEIEEDIPFE